MYAPNMQMNQPSMYGMGGMPFGGGYGGYGGFGGGYGGGFNPMFGGIGGLGFNPMFGPGFGQPISPFGGGMSRRFGGFGGYPQFGGFGGEFGGGFGGYPQFGGFGGFSPMFGGIGGLGFNPFMGPDFGRRMPQRDMRQELFGNLKKPQPAVEQVPEDIGYTMEHFPQVEEFKSVPDAEVRGGIFIDDGSIEDWQAKYNRRYPGNRMTMDVAPTLDQFIQSRTNSPINELLSQTKESVTTAPSNNTMNPGGKSREDWRAEYDQRYSPRLQAYGEAPSLDDYIADRVKNYDITKVRGPVQSKDQGSSGGIDLFSKLTSLFPAMSRAASKPNLPAAPAGKKWFTGMSGIPRLVDANLNTAMMD